jgi:predicted DCC family thiol-disulfide oxidoreductase YuxK
MGWVLFFDGDCAFCSRGVQRAFRLDKRGQISFAPLQGKLAAELGFAGHAAKDGGTMVVLRESDGKVFFKSDALIEVARVLGGWWHLAALARFIPKPLRDFGYGLIANNRYRISGKSESCELPDPELRKRLRE